MAAIDSPEQHAGSSIATCVTCGSALAGPFCSACGEKSAAIRHYDVRHFFAESLEHLTHIDHTVLKSLRLLLFRPGALTQLFMSGQRKNYLGPVQLFLVMNLVFFFVQSFFWTGPFSVPLEAQMNVLPFKGVVRKRVDSKVAL